MDSDNDGVPDPPAASLLRAKSTAAYDAEGRQYQTETFSVDPSTGSASSNGLVTNTYYDRRGNVVETASPGGLVTRTHYDGAGRAIVTYTTAGGGGSSWAKPLCGYSGI